MPNKMIGAHLGAHRALLWLAIATSAGIVFLIDATLVQGVAGPILYLPVIWLAFQTRGVFDVYATAVLCSLLAIVDQFVSPMGSDVSNIALNRGLGISAIWMTAVLCVEVLRSHDRLDARIRFSDAIIEESLDAVISIDHHGRIVDWNPMAENHFGWARSEVVGHELASLIIPPQDRDAHRAGMAHYLTTGEGPILGQRLELTACRRDGTEFPVELTVTAVQLGDDVVFCAFLRDISRRTEDAAYRARLTALVNSSNDAIIGKDLDGTIISWNAGAERVYGYTEDEMIGQTINRIVPPDVENEEDEILRAMQTGQRLEQFETIRRHKEGQLIPVSLTVSPIADEHGSIIGSSTIERDIRERMQLDEEMRLAKDSAEQANRARADFLANVSHELRTPMNAIIGMTRIALDEDLTDEVRDCVQTANDSAHSLLALLNDILDFSKLESGKFTLDEKRFDLRPTLDDTTQSLSTFAFEKGLELVCDVAREVPEYLVGDALRLKQVLINLISNAIKFTEQGEVVVSVHLLETSPHESRLRFAVRDTGVGISPEDQQHIREPFTQADSSTTRGHGGTGLGLAICRELLQLMGAKLSIDSQVGQGSRFSFDLWLARQSEPAKAVNAMPLEKLRGLPVLVVDDNETNRRIIAQVLENWSMRPESAASGEEALGKFDRSVSEDVPYPLVIVDALMPKMDGYTLVEEIIERSPHPPPVLLMVSSSDRQQFKDRNADARVAAFLQKPVSQSDLLDAVMRALNVVAEEPETEIAQSNQVLAPVTSSVLLVEDTPANQKVVTHILEKRGHTVTVAQNGREALDIYRKRNPFDVILMDVQMPIMDGYQATAAIRELEAKGGTSTPIIAMTAHAMQGDREKCLDAGMNEYLAKPIDVSELVELVENAGRSRDRLAPQTRKIPGDPVQTNGGTRDTIRADAGAESQHGNREVIDLEETMQRLAGDMDLLRDFVRYFDQDSPGLLSDLRDAIDSGDAPAVQLNAHSLKGLAANFGAKTCIATAQELEELGASGVLDTANPKFSLLERQLAELADALAKYRA